MAATRRVVLYHAGGPPGIRITAQAMDGTLHPALGVMMARAASQPRRLYNYGRQPIEPPTCWSTAKTASGCGMKPVPRFNQFHCAQPIRAIQQGAA